LSPGQRSLSLLNQEENIMQTAMAETPWRPEYWRQSAQDVRATTQTLIEASHERHRLARELMSLIKAGAMGDSANLEPLLAGLATHMQASLQWMGRLEAYLVTMDTPAVAFQLLEQPLIDFGDVADHEEYLMAGQEADACLQQGLLELTERWQQDESEVERQLGLLLFGDLVVSAESRDAVGASV
jgi:hypothetical protein